MSFFGTKVPMERTGVGFVLLVGDDLLQNVVEFFFSTYSNDVGDRGEVLWDHRFGVPFEMMRHRNIKAGMIERFVAISNTRFKKYAAEYIVLTAFERFDDLRNTMWQRWSWRNAKTRQAPEDPTDVELSPQ